jgi:hypothetical protein
MVYMVEVMTGLPGERRMKRVGLPRLNFRKALDDARDASILQGPAYVYALDGHIQAAYEGGNELPRERW